MFQLSFTEDQRNQNYKKKKPTNIHNEEVLTRATDYFSAHSKNKTNIWVSLMHFL